jgi:hypothetical protein
MKGVCRRCIALVVYVLLIATSANLVRGTHATALTQSRPGPRGVMKGRIHNRRRKLPQVVSSHVLHLVNYSMIQPWQSNPSRS